MLKGFVVNDKSIVVFYRLPIDASNCGSEADLYGLVSNILDEPESMDPYTSYFSEK